MFAVLSIVIFIVVVVNGVCLCFSVGSVIAMACVGCVHNCFPFRAKINDTNMRMVIQARFALASEVQPWDGLRSAVGFECI